jgi:hypothetical protein
MNKQYQRVKTRFEPETRFELRPALAMPLRAEQETELERLKSRLLEVRLARAKAPGLNLALRRAANDAAALAWVTAYPLLVFPVLFDEKARTALLQAQRQDCVRERSRELLAV